VRGHGIDGQHDGIVQGNLLAGFCHLRDVEGDRWAVRFAQFVRKCSKNTNSPLDLRQASIR
jgi:cobyrinic acid a,c-diamide synthase